MNRRYFQFKLGLEPKVVELYCKFAVGSTGAPTINTAASKGIASIARNSAGNYTITLEDKYNNLFQVTPMVVLASGSPASGAAMVVRSYDVQSAKTVVVEFLNGSFSATDIASGSTVVLKLELKASKVGQ